ncbi:DNA-protecting protein DprA [Candidatus Shapirobacteria bacterium CG09_land_8_20_14_0_10_39_12]|uniref:DNA-protecting protein DprA n=1 Tax=Candidatus Shapirobacteria bacterium CG09_land_8_20_14_0_10_39_12 TaxID=1974885 RepID=A0A2H0WQN0_9BACT|nr:MAG: DNA-protecting protein DprA [Candidatus Shapirobacteria bacterium CG09_land_8_20_14_0_10_39_12]
MLKIPNWPINKTAVDSKEWPKLLNQLKDPPKILYYRGNLNPDLFEKSLAIVGSRRMTGYGERVSAMIIPSLVAEGVTIISGFMYGVDTKAHQECLDCGGKTIAVLGGGLNVLYPPENEKLYERIVENGGLIISEYPPGQQPQLWTFVKRNRIVAGLATLGVLIIEAGEKSGSLVTAKIARSLKKPVFATPGPLTSSVSTGTNRLIKEGLAKMVLSANDIVKTRFTTPYRPTDKILDLLSAEPLTLDELAIKLDKNVIETGQILTMLSLKGEIEERGGKWFIGN